MTDLTMMLLEGDDETPEASFFLPCAVDARGRLRGTLFENRSAPGQPPESAPLS